ncbi:peptide chain release factor N(5)-glutamine methyltransferase [Propionivibrio dicarboxylicus]|uniref:Release factor glutamine methyltransferase n=1 Tax=Propionivibrio dicarboxylicus TaxID=83767 RepID=A0A1G8JUH7_9RHOO|nr:peptide chain release factor N(5)-glutamine methyltransferase [Propionivibrio dicarboxylicus]SDI34838.1 release factor glutamine methyltransferase [Propionivibrio dicarboxylicus]
MSGAASIGEAWRQASQRIGRGEARSLLETVCVCSHADLIAHPERLMSEDQVWHFDALVARRENGEPLAYLLGSAWFAGLEFAVSPAVLIPRPDTEVLVNLAAERAVRLPTARIVDLGTGSGIIPVVLSKRCPAAALTAVDVSAAALAVAQSNAVRHGAAIRFLEGDWYAPLAGERFDLIVSNPPYIADGDPHLAGDGLPFEPQGALTDQVLGGDGMACLAAIIDGASAHLAPGGWLLMEHGYDQAVKVRERLAAAGFREIASWRDEAGIERVSGGTFGEGVDGAAG